MRRPLAPRFWAMVFFTLLLGAYAAGCGDSSSGSPPPGTPVDELFQALADSLAAIPSNPGTDYVKNIRYPDIRNGFIDVLAADPHNRKAHLGSALLDLIEVNYDARLWAFIDSLETYSDSPAASALPGIHFRRSSPILRNQFTLLATAPRELARQAMLGIPSNLTVAELQEILESVVIPAVTSALDHLDVTDGGGGNMAPIYLTVEDETIEIDMGEVLFFHAATYVVRAALRIATAYDMGLPGPDGTYGWIDDVRGFDSCTSTGEFEPIPGTPYFRAIQHSYYNGTLGDASSDSAIVAVAEWNLMNRSAFLRPRNGGMSAAYDDLVAAREYLELAVAAIRAEAGTGDDQVDDVIKVVDLTDIDHDIATDPNKPNFATNFMTIEDVLAWVEDVMSGPYVLSEDNQYGCPMSVTIDLSTFFHAAPTDWRALLPYHRFKAHGDWISDDPGVPWMFTFPAMNYSFWTCNGPIDHADVTEFWGYSHTVRFDPIEFTDPSGTPIDLDVVKIPYLRDYTMSGLFPNANRATWEQLVATCP